MFETIHLLSHFSKFILFLYKETSRKVKPSNQGYAHFKKYKANYEMYILLIVVLT